MSPDGIPGFYNFRDICNQHDVCYARFSNGSHQYGTNEWGRLTCDNQFLSNMNNYCYNRFAWYDPRRNTCLSIAGTYYSAVRRLGAPFAGSGVAALCGSTSAAQNVATRDHIG